MSEIVIVIVSILAGCALLLYVVSVWLAGKYSVDQTPKEMRGPLIEMTTLFGAALATNLGATLGVDVPGLLFGDPTPTPDPSLSLGEWARLTGTVAYLLSLFIALWFWWRTGFETDTEKVVRTIPEQGRMLWGILAGTLVLVFSF